MRAIGAMLALAASQAAAGDRLLMTGGATTVEGSAGGGIVPWAVLSGYGTDTQQGGTVFATRVDTGDYALDAAGAAWTFRNRIELSYARQRLHLDRLQRALSLPVGVFDQDVYGAKLRVSGDLIYGRGPQWAVGVQHKRHRDFDIPRAVGARDDRGTDAYLSATRLFLGGAGGYNLLLNATARWTRANQAGLLGFGGDRREGASLQFEASAAVLLDRHWVAGVEYRRKPDNLRFAREDDWADVFVGWFPDKRVALVAAWADLGAIATLEGQRGAYLSVQVSY